MDETQKATDGRAVQQTDSPSHQIINIEKLAEKVYQLMREEIRLSQARGDIRKNRR